MNNQKNESEEAGYFESIPESAKALGNVSNDTVRRLIAAGELAAVRVRRRVLVVRESRKKFVARGGSDRA